MHADILNAHSIRTSSLQGHELTNMWPTPVATYIDTVRGLGRNFLDKAEGWRSSNVYVRKSMKNYNLRSVFLMCNENLRFFQRFLGNLLDFLIKSVQNMEVHLYRVRGYRFY